MNIYEAANYYLNEVMDLPKDVPDYRITNEHGVVYLRPTAGDLSGFHISIAEFGNGWNVAFDSDIPSTDKYALTNDFNFKVIPAVFSIVKDYYDNQSMKPAFMRIDPKREDDEVGASSKRGRVYKRLIPKTFPDSTLDIKTDNRGKEEYYKISFDGPADDRYEWL